MSGDWGTQRQVEMGKAGFKFDVILGDAFGRFSATPLPSIYDVFQKNLLPYAEAVEGTNEPDLQPSAASSLSLALARKVSDTPAGDWRARRGGG